MLLSLIKRYSSAEVTNGTAVWLSLKRFGWHWAWEHDGMILSRNTYQNWAINEPDSVCTKKTTECQANYAALIKGKWFDADEEETYGIVCKFTGLFMRL